MASLISEANNRWRILFLAPDGSRKTLRPGKMDRRSAEGIKRHVEALLVSKVSGEPVPRVTGAWLNEIGDELREKLARVGLVEDSCGSKVLTLGGFLADYVERRSDLTKGTIVVLDNARRCLLTYFGADRLLNSITKGDARAFARWLATPEARIGRHDGAQLTDPLSPATQSKRLTTTKQFFEDATERELIARNPFLKIKCGQQVNPIRDRYVTPEEFNHILKFFPDAEWRLLLALARYGALRCSSETHALRWSDIDFTRRRIRVRSRKTTRYGKGVREMPLFPQLVPFLHEARELCPPGEQYCLWSISPANPGTQVRRVMKRAGMHWPRAMQQLRASRAKEIERQFGEVRASEWCGHSKKIAEKHYWGAIDEDFDRAAGGAKSGALEAQNQAQQTTADDCQQTQHLTQAKAGECVILRIASDGEDMQRCSVVPAGFERAAFSSLFTSSDAEGGAESGALPHTSIDSDLAQVVRAWPCLPGDARRAIVSIALKLSAGRKAG